LEHRQVAIDEKADQTVREARLVADAVVATARVTADELLRCCRWRDKKRTDTCSRSALVPTTRSRTATTS
jgi:hypothetical protein